ncbi:Histone-lysine N-methyltransferase [Bertholletia excelsa]
MGKRPRATEEGQAATEQQEEALFECADLILPWLCPSELAAVSSTCKTLRRISKSITVARSSDASRGFENLAIPFASAVDDHPYAYFIYTPTHTLGFEPFRSRQPWGLGFPGSYRSELFPAQIHVGYACGCECERCDEDSRCPCMTLNSSDFTHECGPGCRCGLECGNRLVQRGISVRLKVVKDTRKGWCLCADQFLKCGQFVCEYAGELLTTKEARRRQERYDQLASSGQFSSALLVVKEHLPSGKACMRINIDATVIGNVARFINHSCDGGNLSTVIVRSSGALLPRICFYASRDVRENEELTFSYGETRLKSKGIQCFCGSSCCFGTLPYENT